MTERRKGLAVSIVGGCGRAGLPLALAFARAGLRVGIYDIDATAVALVRDGVMPFIERGADTLLRDMIAADRLEVSASPSILHDCPNVIVVVGTPIDEFLNPSMTGLMRCVDDIAAHLAPRTLVVLRSTVFPGSSEWLKDALAERGADVDVAMCPERITEGFALEELTELPQIIGADTVDVAERADRLFDVLVCKTIRTTTREAELAKLLTNAWRYMKFAVANHFFMIATSAGLDYGRVLRAVREDYPRAEDLPGPGFAAGPCLLKDTMQLGAFGHDNFLLGQAAMVVNEGLPDYLVRRLEQRMALRGRTVGILGMAFKKESDDTRASLSYKLRKLLVRAGATVLCADAYIRSEDILPLADVVDRSDVLIVAAPHDAYRSLDLTGKEVIDVWGALGPIRT